MRILWVFIFLSAVVAQPFDILKPAGFTDIAIHNPEPTPILITDTD